MILFSSAVLLLQDCLVDSDFYLINIDVWQSCYCKTAFAGFSLDFSQLKPAFIAVLQQL